MPRQAATILLLQINGKRGFAIHYFNERSLTGNGFATDRATKTQGKGKQNGVRYNFSLYLVEVKLTVTCSRGERERFLSCVATEEVRARELQSSILLEAQHLTDKDENGNVLAKLLLAQLLYIFGKRTLEMSVGK
ncbi:hypothetical protein STEG23_029696, partial [Scotinomys teguina]